MDELTKEFIAESQEGLDRMERCLTELETRPDDAGLLGEIFRAVHTIKGTTGFLGFDRLEKLAHSGEHLLGSLRDGRLAVTSDLISGLLRLMDGLRAILVLIEETGSEGTRASDEDGELIAELAMLNGEVPEPEMLAPQIALVETSPVADAVSAAAKSGSPGSPALQPTVVDKAAGNDKTLRIDVDVLNRMMNLVGELVLTRNQMLQSGMDAANFPELARRLDSVTADLRETVMQARMQPVGNLFGKFPRMVRDLARTCGRDVRVEFSGQETGLDKSLLEAIKDPLTHAVRNAVDHGIESPADRVLAGKSAEGCLRLKAYHQSGSVVIEVEDDGAGIPIERVLQKAVERNLVTAEDAARMSEREALQLIFLPGFSTAAAVTTVSGRGVGMDVVRANVEKVGGSVEVESRRGVGTTLRLRVPLTLAIVPSLVVKSGGQAFALPQSTLVELVDIPQREFAQVVQRIGSAELYRLRERLLPMVWLDRLLGLESDNPELSKGHYLAVLEAEGCRYGLVVDDLMSPEEIVVKPLSPVLREIGLFSGATILGNGTLALILDIGATAARAGVKPIEEEMVEIGAGEVAMQEAAGTSFLIFEDRARERTALPLDVVERIESVPLAQIEYAGGRAMLQYRGELLPLKDEGSVLAELETARQLGEEGMATVLICGDAGVGGVQRGGMIVRRVLDVSEGTLLDRDAATGDVELALVKEKLTLVHREFGVKAKAGMAGGRVRLAGREKVDEIQDENDAVSLCSMFAGSETFGIDTRKIREVLGERDLQRVPMSPTYIAGVVPYRGEVLTTVNLRALLGMEAHSGKCCVLVMTDDQAGERFGLVVDEVGGVVTVSRRALEDNPCTLEARGKWLFDGAYKMEAGLMVQLDPQKLCPSRLSETGLFKTSLNGGIDASPDR